MTKRNYIALAALVASWRTEGIFDDAAVDRAAHTLADFCAEDNARFDRDRFLSACGVKS
jgi:hypothetical protein